MDKELEHRGYYFRRHADDYNIYAQAREAGEQAKASVGSFLEEKHDLQENRG